MDGPCRHTAYNGVRLHVLRHHRPGADDSPVPDGHAGQDHGLIPDPHVVAHDDIALVVPGRGNVLYIRAPFLKEQGKGVRGQGPQRVIGAVEQELRAAGDGAELADDQSLVIDGIVVQYTIALKIPGIVDKS